METILRGLTTVSFYASNLEEAKKWYTNFLNIEPYFSAPGYVEFRIGDYQHELGIIDSQYAPEGATERTGGALIYWHVDHLQKTLDKLLSSGAELYQPIIDRSGGKGDFVTASVVDPFGNILGIMTNRHYVEIIKLRNSFL
ncbi:glyoxalase [Chryseobacterium lactis]|uniref:Glyoxalase n=1 Tax=Chryseobacterium lactis TaxID=1241981 RepID=A0A3G6RSS1_CHRLC|nr:VOC family protein [Chryseobacterium lactis]AZA84616.1 VOC family protein [Chryseobacterium lactis]AZB05004.1 VOC family protein [Chryseobacterium lactis]PNW14735.1 glyoxalase [Chryseobacterium lactis]